MRIRLIPRYVLCENKKKSVKILKESWWFINLSIYLSLYIYICVRACVCVCVCVYVQKVTERVRGR